MQRPLNIVVPALFAALFAYTLPASAGSDAAAAKTLIKKNNCHRCHALTKKKPGPSWRQIANDHINIPDSEEELFKHLTTAPPIHLKDLETEHKIVVAKGATHDEQVRNLSQWILEQAGPIPAPTKPKSKSNAKL